MGKLRWWNLRTEVEQPALWNNKYTAWTLWKFFNSLKLNVCYFNAADTVVFSSCFWKEISRVIDWFFSLSWSQRVGVGGREEELGLFYCLILNHVNVLALLPCIFRATALKRDCLLIFHIFFSSHICGQEFMLHLCFLELYLQTFRCATTRLKNRPAMIPIFDFGRKKRRWAMRTLLETFRSVLLARPKSKTVLVFFFLFTSILILIFALFT